MSQRARFRIFCPTCGTGRIAVKVDCRRFGRGLFFNVCCTCLTEYAAPPGANVVRGAFAEAVQTRIAEAAREERGQLRLFQSKRPAPQRGEPSLARSSRPA